MEKQKFGLVAGGDKKFEKAYEGVKPRGILLAQNEKASSVVCIENCINEYCGTTAEIYFVAENGFLEKTRHEWEDRGRRYTLKGIRSLLKGNSEWFLIIDRVVWQDLQESKASHQKTLEETAESL